MAGPYVFHVTAVEYNQQHLSVDIDLNSVSKVRLMGENDAPYQTGTNMVVPNLKMGDSGLCERFQWQRILQSRKPLFPDL